ncbi:hypothetical protein NPIL_274151, partial [Nephila pilipes]
MGSAPSRFRLPWIVEAPQRWRRMIGRLLYGISSGFSVFRKGRRPLFLEIPRCDLDTLTSSVKCSES